MAEVIRTAESQREHRFQEELLALEARWKVASDAYQEGRAMLVKRAEACGVILCWPDPGEPGHVPGRIGRVQP